MEVRLCFRNQKIILYLWRFCYEKVFNRYDIGYVRGSNVLQFRRFRTQRTHGRKRQVIVIIVMSAVSVITIIIAEATRASASKWRMSIPQRLICIIVFCLVIVRALCLCAKIHAAGKACIPHPWYVNAYIC